MQYIHPKENFFFFYLSSYTLHKLFKHFQDTFDYVIFGWQHSITRPNLDINFFKEFLILETRSLAMRNRTKCVSFDILYLY